MTRDLRKEAADVLLEGGGYYTVEDLVAEIKNGTMQSYVRERSWVVTHILDFPRRRVLEVVVAVGDLPDVYALEAEVLKFALEQKCHSMVSFGRPGWDKKHSDGWKKVSHRFERVL